MKIDKDKISKYKLDFIKLAELPAPDSIIIKEQDLLIMKNLVLI